MASDRTLVEALADAAQTDEGYVFLDEGVETRRSYAAMCESSIRASESFRAAGLRRGDLVALVAGDSEQFLTALFGASIAGLVPASLYPPLPTGELAQYLDGTGRLLHAAGARAVITTPALASVFEALAERANLKVCIPGPAEAGLRVHAVVGPAHHLPKPDDIAFVQFTSGSTSAPKGVAITHRSLSANIRAINGPAGLASSAADSAVSWLPLHHDMGLVGMALGPMYCGRPAVLMTPQTFVKRPAEWLRAISRYRGTISFAPNFAYDLCVRRVRSRDLDGLDLSSWRVAGCGGEPIHAATLAAFAEKFRAAGFRETSFVPSYGLAEHVLAATLAPHGRSVAAGHAVVGCGRPLPGHQLRIVGEDGRELPERAVGEVTLAGPSVMQGYYGDAALTAETIRDGWLHTGDLGYLDDGELFVCGRLKDIVIANGRKYHPQDLEWAVDELPGVRRGRVVAFAMTRPGRSDRVVIVLETSGTASAAALVAQVRRRVGEACGLYVDEVLLVPSGTIGRTTSGKVQRSATKARYERGELTPST